MNHNRFTRGYTIVEIMIFLAVSAGLIVSALALVSGQQRKTQFSQAVRDIELQIQDVSNDVTSGFYPSAANFKCVAGGSGPVISSGVVAQGANKECIFVGRLIQFGVLGSSGQGFTVFTAVGLRLYTGVSPPQPVATLAQAQPKVIAPSVSSPSVPDVADHKQLQYGLSVATMKCAGCPAAAANPGIVGFFSSLVSSSPTSGADSINLVVVNDPNSALNKSAIDAAEAINANNYVLNPPGGVAVCFASGGNDQHATITIGDNSSLSTSSAIGSGPCP